MAIRRSQRPGNVAYYARNRDRELQRVRVMQAETLRLLRDLRRVPCGDCGGYFLPQQMDFDHRDPAGKSFRLTSGRAMLMSRDRLMAEVRKCDVVCANCHRIRTRAAHAERLARRPPPIAASISIDGRRARWRAHARVLDELRDVPCADCLRRFPPCAMDFDHRDTANKRIGVTRMIGRAGIASILAEAAKCDIVCVNCHRARTHVQGAVRISERE